MDIRPLTKRSQDGVPYHRPEHVTAQIIDIPSLDDPMLLERAALNRQSPDALVEESLVYFVREAVYQERDELASELAAHLLRRCSNTVRRQLRTLGVSDAYVEEAASDVIGTLFGQIVNLDSDLADFFQIRFFSGLASLSTKAATRYRGYQEQQAAAVAFDGTDNQEVEDDRSLPPQISDQDMLYPPPTGEDMTLVRAALATLDPHLRQVFVLRHYYHFPIDSEDASTPTLSAYFGKTPKTIYNWLKRAEEQLRQWRNEEQI